MSQTAEVLNKGNEYIVKVIDSGSNNPRFEYDGRIYKSLSAIATDITGTRWNGYTFFKLKKNIKNVLYNYLILEVCFFLKKMLLINNQMIMKIFNNKKIY